jgi:primosomal protein N'
MAVFKCKICGGALDIYQEMTVGKCQFCGTVITLPRIGSDRRANLHENAH